MDSVFLQNWKAFHWRDWMVTSLTLGFSKITISLITNIKRKCKNYKITHRGKRKFVIFTILDL